MTEKNFWTKLSQGTRHGSISKLKKQKSNPNSGCILIPRVNQRNSSEPSLAESVWLLCSGTGKVFFWWNAWNVAQPSLQPHTALLLNVYEGQFRTSAEECHHQALSFFMTMHGRTLQLRQRSSCRVFDGTCLITHHTAQSLAPSDFHLFVHMKHWLGGQKFGSENELQTSIEHWLKAQVAAFYDKGIGKLAPRYDKYLSRRGDYVEK